LARQEVLAVYLPRKNIRELMAKAFTIEDIKKSKVAHLNQHLLGTATKKKNKYGAVKVEMDGYVFDSKKEAARYIQLRMRAIVRDIIDLRVHVVFQLSVCKYEADFVYYEKASAGEWVMVVEDVKSKMTRRLSTYRLKKKLMLAELKILIKEV
jgi:hypothetical protein